MRFSIIAGSHVPLGAGEPGTGIRLASPQTATGLRLGDVTFTVDPGIGAGLRLVNPETPTGMILGSATVIVTPPLPVAAPTINSVASTGATTLRVSYTDNQTAGSDYFNVKVRDVLADSQVQDVATTSNPYNVQGLTADTLYEITMTATYMAFTSTPSGGVVARTQDVTLPGDFYPDVKYINFERFNYGDQIITDGVQLDAYDGAGTGATWDDPANISLAREWYRQVYIDDGQPPQPFTNTTEDLTEVRSGTRSGVIYVVRKDEMSTAPPYNSAMGVASNVENYNLTDGTEFWYKFDLKLPADFDPHTGVSTLKFHQLSTMNPVDRQSTGAMFLNMYASSGVYPGGWCLDTAEQRKDLPEVQQNWYFLPESHPDIAGKPWQADKTVVLPDRFGWVRDEWMRIEIYATVAYDPADAVFRMWMNEELAIEHFGVPNLRLPSYKYSFFKFFSYWNGAKDSTNIPKFGTFRYDEPARILIDNVVITTGDNPPPNKDTEGNLMIGGWPTVDDPLPPDPPTDPVDYRNFDGGTNGALANTDASGYDSLLGPGNLVHFSNAQWNSSPLSSRFTLPPNNTSDTGAALTAITPIVMGEFWIQCKVFIPSGFVWPKLANGSRPSEGLKFLRADYQDAADSYLGAWDCYIYDNGLYAAGAMSDFGAGSLQSTYSSTLYRGMGTIRYSQWMTVEYYVKLDTGTGGIYRAWLNNQLVGDFNNFQSAITSADELFRLKVFSGPQPSVNPNITQYLYVDDIIIKSNANPPSNTDSNGYPYIGDLNNYGLLFYDNFSNGQTNDSNGFSWRTMANVEVSNVWSRSGGYALRYTYNGVPDNSDSFAEAPITLADDLGSEVWIQWYMYFPDGTEGTGDPEYVHRDQSGETNNKFFALYSRGRPGHTFFGETLDYINFVPEMLRNLSGEPRLDVKMRGRYTGMPTSIQCTTNYNGMDKSNLTIPKGQWNKVVVHAKMATIATDGTLNSDGVLQMWLNGNLEINETSIGTKSSPYTCSGYEDGFQARFTPTQTVQRFWEYCYFLGHANSGFDVTTYAYIDEVAVARDELSLPSSSSNYSPDYHIGFRDGTNGQTAVGTSDSFDGYASNVQPENLIFSNEVAPWSSGLVAKAIRPAGKYDWGGAINRMRGDYAVGDEFWVRTVTYYPNGFLWCSGCTEGMKFHRLYIDGTGNWGFYLAGPNGMGVSSSVGYCTRKEFYKRYDQYVTDDPACTPQPLVGHYAQRNIGPAIPEGEWVIHESYIKLHPTNGAHRYWTNGTLVFEETDVKTCDTLSNYLYTVALWTYHNGGVGLPQDHAYVDCITITGGDNPPPNKDSNNNLMIGDWKP